MNVFKKRDGLSIVETIVAIGLLSVGAFIALDSLRVSSIIKGGKNVNNVIKLQRDKLVGLLNTRNAWKMTVDSNNITCLRVSGTDCAVGIQNIALYDGSNVKMSDLAGNNLGYDVGLNLCDYSQSNCVFRFLIAWSPICESSTTCTNPLISVQGTFEMKPSLAESVKNPTGYNFKFIRGTFASNIIDNCQSIGGTYDYFIDRCTLPHSNQECPAGQIVVGITGTGNIICDRIMDNECTTPGTYAKGVNPDGTLVCYPLLPACPSTPPTGFNTNPVDNGYDINGTYYSDGSSDGGDCGGDDGDCGE